MRVIGGEFRSRVLKSLPGLDVRPTPDRLRETLFDILALRIEGATFADVYAGTGAVGIEALSRGAASVIFVEQNRDAVALIKENLRSLRVDARAQVRIGRAASVIPVLAADIIFIDPPYQLEGEYIRALTLLGESPNGFVIAQHSKHLTLDEAFGALHRTREVRQGDNVLSFYKRELIASPSPDSTLP